MQNAINQRYNIIIARNFKPKSSKHKNSREQSTNERTVSNDGCWAVATDSRRRGAMGKGAIVCGVRECGPGRLHLDGG